MNALPRILARFTFLRCLALLGLMLGAASPALATKTYSDNGDGTVTDPTTGLTWMRCAMGQTWDGSTCTGTASNYTWDQANALTGTVTFAGRSDWRVPHIRELTTMVDRTRFNPAIDVIAFPNTDASYFWSASAYASSSSFAWIVIFDYGYAGYNFKGSAIQVRLVRAGQSFGLLDIARPSTDYVDQGNGTVTHTPTSLMWQRCAVGQTWTGSSCSGTASTFTWDAAKLLTSTFAGQTDWRLPTEEELLSLVDYSQYGPAINGPQFPNTDALSFWSASVDASSSGNAWGVNFDGGGAYNYGKGYGYQVRLVRAGQSFAPFSLTVAKTGNGTVSGSAMTGINCGSSCTTSYTSGTTVVLIATPEPSWLFTGWSGACTGSGSCVVNMNASKNVTANFTLSAPSSRLTNISTRGQVQTGDNVMIGGFVIASGTPKTVLIRARGPSLSAYGVPGVLANPVVQLYSGQTVIASNDNWQSASNAAAIQATGLAPSNSLESAILTTLNPGNYTAIVSGAGGSSGIGIVEVFEIDNQATPLINISTRGPVQTGDSVMIGGFVITGSSPQTVLIRARGPSLSAYGVPGVLANPMVQLYSGQTVIASNDNWQSASNAVAIQATGLAPSNSLESAILITLQPGAYTAIVSGADGGSGVGIVEVIASAVSSNTTISGTVATGAPVVATVVTAGCQANQSFTSRPTDTLGTYTVVVPTAALPCINSVTLPSGEVFRAFAVGAGSTVVANITPLTELVVRRAGSNPANFQRGTQETLQLLSTMQVPFTGDPTTAAFVPNGTGNDAALLKLFPRMASTLANGQSTMAFGTNLSAYERIDPSTYPAVMPLVDDPLWDAIQLGTAKAVNETFFGVGGYFSDKLDPPSQLLVEKLINYGMGVMFKEMAKKSFAKCAATDCAQKIVLALAKSLKDDATNSPTNYLKDIISNPLEIIASSVFDSIADFYEARLTDYLMSDGTLSFWDNVELVSVTYGGRVAAHTAINQFIGGKPLPLATLQAEFSVGFDFAKQDIVNLFYIAKMTYDTAKENQLTVNMFQVYLVRKNFRSDATATYSDWLATNHSADVMSALRAKAQAAKNETQRLAQLLPTEQKLAQSNLANSLIDQILASYQSNVNAVLLANTPPVAAFTASLSVATVNQTITFDPSGSSDIDGNIVTYAWNFGDGQISSSSSAATVSHAFGSAGTYVVTLTVTDNLGATNAKSKSVTVAPLTCTGGQQLFNGACVGPNFVTSISTEFGLTCVSVASGSVSCWGANEHGQLGDGTTIGQKTPGTVRGLSERVIAVSTSGFHACGLTDKAGIECWGYNQLGQLGDGSATDRYLPVDVQGLSSGVSAVSAGGQHTCALTTAGGVKCWGANDHGQLGDGSGVGSNIPVNVQGLSSGVVAVDSGSWHTCALMATGGIKCWGYNLKGELGDGTTTVRYSPVNVIGLTNRVTALSAGFLRTCVVNVDGGVKCWGYNDSGQVGDGSTTDRYLPVNVQGLLSGVAAVSAGGGFTCALMVSGGVKCWGNNGWGQLGDGTGIESHTAVNVQGLTNGVRAVSSGYREACAILVTGSVKCWGNNESGQLGDGTIINRYTPVNVLGLAP